MSTEKFNSQKEDAPLNRKTLKVIEREHNGIVCKEILGIENFSEAVHVIREIDGFITELNEEMEEMGEIETMEERDPFKFLLIDIDGTLISRIKLLGKPDNIDEETFFAFKEISDIFKDSVAIVTNRREHKYIFPNSPRVVAKARELANEYGKETPIYSGLFKQIPGIRKENVTKKILEAKIVEIMGSDIDEKQQAIDNIFKEWSESVYLLRTQNIIDDIGKEAALENKSKIILYSIEDLSFVSLNRRVSLLYIAKKLKKEYNIEVTDIINLVIDNSR